MNTLFTSSTEHLLQLARQTIQNSQLDLVKNLGIDRVQTSFESIDGRINEIKNDVLSNHLEDAFELLSQMQTSYDYFKNIAKPLSSQNEALKKVLDCYDQILSQHHKELIKQGMSKKEKQSYSRHISVNNNDIELKSIEDDKEIKIQQVLFECRGVKRLQSSEIENLMNQLIELLPFFDYEQISRFTIDFLPDLLYYSKKLVNNQCDLAFALSQALINYATNQSWSIHHVFWRQGMAYLAKALTIAIEKNLDVKFYHQKAHVLILNLSLRSPLFDEQKNAIPGDAKKFEKLIISMAKLERFCSSSSDEQLIKKCYSQTQKFYNSIPTDKISLFDKCHELLSARLKAHIPFSPFSTERYRDKLKALRKQFPAAGLRNEQADGTKLLREFLTMMIDDAMAIVGPPPCDYDFRALGSIAKDEGCPYSDLEAMILIQDEKYRPYFQHLTRVLELLLISIDESPTLKDISSVFTCLPAKLGLHLDKGANPANTEELICNPENMAKHQLSPLDDEFITSWDHATRKSVSLHSSTKALFESYQKRVGEIAEGERKKRGLALLKTRLKDFGERWGAKKEFPVEVDLKGHFSQLFQHFFSDLSIYFGIKEGNSIDIIDQLSQVFDPLTRDILKDIVVQLHAERIRLHHFYQYPTTLMLFHDERSKRNVYAAPNHERNMLEGIYILVLKPLYLVLSVVLESEPTKVKSLYDKIVSWFSNPVDVDLLTHPQEKFERFFKNINLIEFCFNSFYEPNYLSDHQKKIVVEFAARMLCRLKESMPQLIHLYQKLSTVECQDDLLRKTFLEIVNRYQPEIATQIAQVPNREGFRRSWQNNIDRFQADIADITMDRPHQDGSLVQVKITTPKGKFYLKPEVIKHIIDNDGNIIKHYSSSHNVHFCGSLHFKQKPYLPLKEYAVHNFKSRCFGSLGPESQLVLFEVERGGLLSNIRYPVLISQTIEGETLEQNQKIDWEKCDKAQWTREFISEVLIPPGDGSINNYISPKKNNSIYGIDHDLSWVEPVLKVNFFKVKINFCSALFCLFPNVALDPAALKDFCDLNPSHIFISWMKDVIKKEEEYRALFSEEDVKKWRQEKKPTTFDTTFTFREGTLETLAILFSQLQNYIRTALGNKKTLTPLDLLSKLIHMKKGDINKGIGEKVAYCYRHAGNNSSINDQLKKITQRDSSETLSSLQSAQAILGEIPSDQSINDAKKMTPKEALNELIEFSLIEIEQVLFNESMVQANFKNASIDKQKTCMTYLKFLIEERKYKPKKVVLNHCEVLDSALLLNFLNDELEHLDLRYCSKLKDVDISKMQYLAPNLRELYLGGSSNIQSICSKGWVEDGPLTLSKLQTLHIEDCVNLTSISIVAPLLHTIVCRNNAVLKTFKVMSFPIDNISPNSMRSQIQVKCDNITKQTWFELRKNDEEFILHGLGRDGMSLGLCNLFIRNQHKYVEQAIKNKNEALCYATDRVALSCISKDYTLLKYARSQLQLKYLNRHPEHLPFAKSSVVKRFLSFNGLALKHAGPFQNDKGCVLTALNNNGLALEHAGPYQDDEDFVLVAVRNNGLALVYASDRLINKLNVVIAAMFQNINAYRMASPSMQKHRDVVTLRRGYFYYLIRYCFRITVEEEHDDRSTSEEKSGLMVSKDDMS